MGKRRKRWQLDILGYGGPLRGVKFILIAIYYTQLLRTIPRGMTKRVRPLLMVIYYNSEIVVCVIIRAVWPVPSGLIFFGCPLALQSQCREMPSLGRTKHQQHQQTMNHDSSLTIPPCFSIVLTSNVASESPTHVCSLDKTLRFAFFLYFFFHCNPFLCKSTIHA